LRGDNTSLFDTVVKAIEKGELKVVGRAIGTYTEGSGPRYE